MSTTPVKIELTDTSTGRLEVDGHDITNQTARFVLTAVPGKEPQLTIQLVHGLHAELDARIVLATSTRAALVALGWTPPTDDRPTGRSGGRAQFGGAP